MALRGPLCFGVKISKAPSCVWDGKESTVPSRKSAQASPVPVWAPVLISLPCVALRSSTYGVIRPSSKAEKRNQDFFVFRI